ncbi:MAG: tetratricopeptide repeat protein [Cyanobacteriota bacterium]
MLIPIIKSKFKIPKISDGHKSRQELLYKLESGSSESKKLTLVVGNAGYGKSTLVADYVYQTEHKCFWYSLTENDADIAIFINHFVKGMKLIFPTIIDESFEMLISSSNYSESVIENIIGILIENISDKINEKAIIVIDDFQFIRNSESINKMIEYLIEFLPENIQLILISRYIPNIKKIPQLRVRQQLEEINNNDLKISKNQLKAIIPKELTDSFSEDELEKIYQKTDGWIGILILLIQAYKNGKVEISNLLTSNNDIFEYLALELFEYQEEKVKYFMLSTALFPKITEEFIENANIENSKENINYLKNMNILENSKENEYIYNPVLKDFLREKAKEILTLVEQKNIYNSISLYCESKKNFEQALEYAFLASNYEKSEEILISNAQDLINNNRGETLNKFISLFPEKYFDNSANLQIFAGELKRLWGNYSDALTHYSNAENISLEKKDNSTLAKSYVYKSIIYASKGEPKEELIDKAIKIFPKNDSQGLAFAYNTKGITYLFGEKIQESLSYFEQALTYYEDSNDGTGQAKVLHNLGFAYTMLGSFEHSKNTYERSIKQAENTGKYPYVMTYNNLAIIYNYLGDFKEAHFFAEKALNIAQQLQYKRDMSYAYWTLGMIAANTEDYLKAEDYFNTCSSIGIEIGDRQTQSYALSGLSEIARLQGKISKSLDLIDEAIRRRDLPIDNHGNIELLVQKTTILIDSNNFTEAKKYILEYLIKKIEKINYKYYITHLYFYLALIYEKEDKKLSDDYSKKTLDLIKENNYYFFLKQHKILPEYIKKHESNNEKNVLELKASKISKIKFYCFGDLRTLIEDKAIPNKEWNGFKTKLAISYLLHNPKGVTKEQLANLLYPDTDITRTAINVILSRLRKAIEPDLGKNESSKYIMFNEGKYFFNFASSYFLDTEEFNYLIKESNENISEDEKLTFLQKIIALYEGDFLNEFTSEFWVQLERENYRRKIDKVFEQIFDIYYKRKEFEEIIKISEKELSIDICNEKAFQRKFKALIGLDKKDEVLKHYKIMKNILKTELGVEPSQESYLLYQKISH